MSLDWSRIGAGGQEPLLRPRDIYASLPNKPWPYLRQEQGEVLEKWFARRSDRDLVIKQNTGGGKTVAGLLIAQSTLNEGVGKAVYLAPDTYLAARVRQESARLGLPCTDDHEDPAFLAQEAILVTTFQKLVNGRSVFGVLGDGRDPMDLGVVVVDDAHAALATTESQFRLTVKADHEAYRPILDLFADSLRDQSPKIWEDIRDQEYTAVAPIPFWEWADKSSAVMAILHPYRRDDAFKFEWPLVADVLHLCCATVTSRAIEIRPPCPPIRMIPSLFGARRRVYLTATLSDDSILVTDLDADPADLARVITPGSASDLGDRMILSPLVLDPSLTDDSVRVLARQFADGDRRGDGVRDAAPVNVVVLVPSRKSADAWSSFADRTYLVHQLEAGVSELTTGHVGLVVLVNKYDGIDLPRDACRLLILDGIPAPMDGVERREVAVMTGSPTRRMREVQRIEQGMGRGVRDAEDYCTVLLMGARLGMATYDKDWLAHFSPATRAQLNLSRDIATQIQGQGIGAIREALTVCLDRDPNWVQRSRRAIAEVRYVDAGSVRPEAVAARRAFDLAAGGQTESAANSLQTVINEVADPALRGWLREQKAAYLHFTNPHGAQLQLAAALEENPLLLRPLSGISPTKLRASSAQARASAEFLERAYDDGVSLVLGVRALLEAIVWDEELTDEAERSWQSLGEHLGFGSSRPEKIYGTGPDNLWALSSDRHAVFELKTGCTTDFISKKDMDQLGGSARWDEEQYPEVSCQPVMIHPSRVAHPTATVVPGMRVVTPEKLEQLKAAVTSFAVALAGGLGSWGDEQATAEQLGYGRLTAGALVDTYSDPVVSPT